MKRGFLLFSLIAFLLISGCTRVFNPEYTVVLTSEKVEKKLQERFPLKAKSGNFDIVFRSLYVNVKERGIFIGTDFGVDFLKIPFVEGDITLSGKPTVDKTGKNIYIEDVSIEKLEVNKRKVLNAELKRAISIVLSEMLKETPIFKLKNRMKIKSIKIHDGKIYVKLQL